MLTESLLIAGAFVLGFAAASVLAALAFSVLTGIHREEQHAIHVERDQWRTERRELLNRVQHPHAMPTGSTRAEPRRPTAGEVARQRDWANVGRIVPGRRDSDAENPDLP
jgi:hypothetical protein